MKLKPSHVAEEWSDSDGYWIAIKSGWKWDDDPIGALHTIHCDSRREAWSEGIAPCNCCDCKFAPESKQTL